MVKIIRYKSDIDEGCWIEIIPTSFITFRSIEKDVMTDVSLSKEDVEDLVHELRLWLAKMEQN